MKLSERKLRKVIQEEIYRVLKEEKSFSTVFNNLSNMLYDSSSRSNKGYKELMRDKNEIIAQAKKVLNEMPTGVSGKARRKIKKLISKLKSGDRDVTDVAKSVRWAHQAYDERTSSQKTSSTGMSTDKHVPYPGETTSY